MPFLYVYSPSDFIGGLPSEQGAMAAGSGPFTLTLAPGATPTLIEVSDNDGVLDEVDYSQSLASGVNIDGISYGSGTTIHSAYDLINSSNGHQVTSIHFGGDGYEQGAVHGLVSTEPLVAGQSYTFNVERTSHRQNNLYEDFVACFTRGTSIRTNSGEALVENLKPGDLVETADGDFKPVRLVLSRTLNVQDFSTYPKLRPICITAGAMGQGLPTKDLMVSPQHRMLVNGPLCARMFDAKEVLVSARKLSVLPGIYVDQDVTEVTYFHLVFDEHQVVFAENAPSESFYCGAEAINGLEEAARTEVLALFPDLDVAQGQWPSARFMPRDSAQRSLVERLRKNDLPVLSD
ncbi:MAG: Hint domain-containing protein [Cognatishimia sp.]|uniref:Hint domain-containing protein n=1 Tax=Cognatishimia sp. TaxID=2211648 RepID=UPI003B8E9EB3